MLPPSTTTLSAICTLGERAIQRARGRRDILVDFLDGSLTALLLLRAKNDPLVLATARLKEFAVYNQPAEFERYVATLATLAQAQAPSAPSAA